MPLTSPAFAQDRYRDAVLATKPVQYWRLRENAGTKALDEMGVANGTYTGSPGLARPGVTGIRDGASVQCTSGAGTYVDGGNGALSTTAYSLAIWVYRTGTINDKGLFTRWSNPGGGAMLWVDTTNNSVSFVHTQTLANWARNATTLPLNQWAFLAQTWDGATLLGYRNGVEVARKSIATSPGTPANNWWIGMYSSTSYIATARYAEAAYWSRALTRAEVAHLSTIGYGG